MNMSPTLNKVQINNNRSVEQGQLRDKIAVVLNSLENMNFKVATRSVRDRYTSLVKKYKKSGVRKRKRVVSTHSTKK